MPSITERSRRRVGTELARLRAEYGSFPVRDKRWEWPPDQHDAVHERVAAGSIGGAGVWLTDDAGRVAMVRKEGESTWSDPGGKHDPGETLEAAARRETREETGLECTIVGVQEVHRIESVVSVDPPEADHRESRDTEAIDRPPIHELIAIFRGEYERGVKRPRDGEIAEVRWFESHPEDVVYEELLDFPIPASEAPESDSG